MKKIFTQFCLFALFCIASVNLNAQTYVLNEQDEHKITIYSDKTYSEINGPCDYLFFEAKRGVGVNGLQVDQYVNGVWQENVYYIKNADLKTTYSPYSCKLDRNATQIRFYNPGGIAKWVKNVKITLPTYVDAPEHNLWEPTAVVGSTDSYGETTMAWSNVAPFTLTLSGEGASQFTCDINNNSSVGNYGTATISATYKHNVAGVHNALLSISNGSATYEIALVGTTVKKDQTITWAADLLSGKLPVGKEVATPATALSALSIVYTSSNDSVIAIINDGTGFKALAAGQATVND